MKKVILTIALATILAGCNSDDNDNKQIVDPNPGIPVDQPVGIEPQPSDPKDPDTPLELPNPVVEPVVDLDRIHGTSTKLASKSTGQVLAMVEYPEVNLLDQEVGGDRLTVYEHVGKIPEGLLFEHLTLPIINVVDESEFQHDKWFINIYVNHQGKNITLNVFSDSTVSTNEDSTRQSWDEAKLEYGDAEIRRDYTERTGLSEFRWGNFMWRSSGTNEVVLGDIFKFIEYQPMNYMQLN
ncbi:hypothetical protein BIZ37_11920 [Photobacterium sp. BZF1]|uniref:hypothetical protein n=1 Tax=Photobacterium sp. BZF1 TaxID=1904457 RepID=UPI0016536F73|nr:hypothetical protein [Photobacterium sp. BZF1]MBC7003267.1 hypothetical protein [Photobacterium sp. BZF1]